MGLSAAVCLALVALVWQRDDAQPPVQATCRQIAADPSAYAGRNVLVDAQGCQPDGNGRLVWRQFADQPPQVVILVDPGQTPRWVAGPCRWGGSGPAVVYARTN